MSESPDSSSSPKPERELPTGIVRVDDFHVSKATGHYPDEAKEPTLWLAAYMRERCDGRRDLVVDAAPRPRLLQGVTGNYVYRVLNGRNTFTRDKERQTRRLRRQPRPEASRRSAPASSSPSAPAAPPSSRPPPGTASAITSISSAPRRASANSASSSRPTGGQKTECAKHYCALNNHGLCVHLEAPARGTMSEFLVDLANRYTRRGGNRSHLSALQLEIRQNVTDRKTIMIDNVQRLYRGRRGRRAADLQLPAEAPGRHRLHHHPPLRRSSARSSSPKGLESGFFEQFEGRAGGRDQWLPPPRRVHAPRGHRPDRPAPTESPKPTSPAVVKYLEAISRKPGRCRILFNSLQQAKREADARGEQLSIDHIRFVRSEEGAK
jgi:hypothetical protein